jgi:putative oxidoreductase
MSKNSPALIIPAVGGLYEGLKPWAYPLMRVTAGLLLMPHGAQKLFGWFGGNIDGTIGFFNKIGLTPATELAWIVGGIEFFGGALIALGLLTRPAAVAAAILLFVAFFKVHLGVGFFWTSRGFEYPLFWAIIMVVIFIRGGGEKSLDNSMGKEF